jgi:hypothetical protein
MWMLASLHPVGTELEVEFLRGRELLQARGRTCAHASRLVGE